MAFKAAALKFLPVSLAIAILGVMSIIVLRDSASIMKRNNDLPPIIDFTWTPIGPTDLREMKGFLSIKDDYALDFTTYKMRIVELDRSYDLPIDGMIGREYEQSVSLSLLADNDVLRQRGKVTVEFSIADDRGQSSTISRTIKLRQLGGIQVDYKD
jgi:hypothetical protein